MFDLPTTKFEIDVEIVVELEANPVIRKATRSIRRTLNKFFILLIWPPWFLLAKNRGVLLALVD